MLFMTPELFEENDDGIHYTNKIDIYAFGIILILTEKYPKFSMRNVITGVLPPLPNDIVPWVKDLIVRCLASSPEMRPSFAEIFEILKAQNYDLFGDSNKGLKAQIDKRVLKIEAFEYQQQNFINTDL